MILNWLLSSKSTIKVLKYNDFLSILMIKAIIVIIVRKIENGVLKGTQKRHIAFMRQIIS
jgi:hypothetical protein